MTPRAAAPGPAAGGGPGRPVEVPPGRGHREEGPPGRGPRVEVDRGSAVAETVMVLGLVVFLFLSVLQVAVWYHVRNVVVASAAEGARYGAVGGRDVAVAEERTRAILASALSEGYAADLDPRASVTVDPDTGVRLVVVRVTGPGPAFLRAFRDLLRLDVRGRSVQEPA